MNRTIRVLHAAYMPKPNAGIVRQMNDEQRSADALGLNWHSKIFSMADACGPIGVQVVAGSRLKFKYLFYRWLADIAPQYDVILLRHTPYDPFELYFIATQKTPIYTVHHTLEYPEIRSRGGMVNQLKAGAEWVLSAWHRRCRHGLVAVTHEIGRYHTMASSDSKYILYPNGICTDNHLRPNHGYRAEFPRIIFVSSYFHAWQGLERLLDDCRGHEGRFELVVVGEVSDVARKKIADDARFLHFDRLNSVEIAKISATCWLGLSSLDLGVKGMSEACPLKVREYLANGLPVYGGHADVFPATFPYFYNGPPSISDILSYADRVKGVSRHHVSNAAAPFIEKAKLLSVLYDTLVDQIGGAQ